MIMGPEKVSIFMATVSEMNLWLTGKYLSQGFTKSTTPEAFPAVLTAKVLYGKNFGGLLLVWLVWAKRIISGSYLR